MVNQYVLVDVAVGVFVVGIGVGYAALQDTTMGPINFGSMSTQQMQQAMQDPNFRQNMMNQFRNDPQSMQIFMNPMMGDPQLQSQMRGNMMQNSQFMQGMMQDPQFGQQMPGPMRQGNTGTMMQNMMNSDKMQNMMNQMMTSCNLGNMMKNWTFDPQTTPSMMKSDPQLRQNMFEQMNTHHNYMTDVISTTGIDDNLKSQVLQHISSHNAVHRADERYLFNRSCSTTTDSGSSVRASQTNADTNGITNTIIFLFFYFITI